jgi:hypothetical protein
MAAGGDRQGADLLARIPHPPVRAPSSAHRPQLTLVADTQDELAPLYRTMLLLGLVGIVILALGFAILLRFAPPGQRSGYRAQVVGVFPYDPERGRTTGPAATRFRRDQPFAAQVDWRELPSAMIVGARWTDSLDDDVGTVGPTSAGTLASQEALVPVKVQSAFHANLPGSYTLTVVRYAQGHPVELLASANVVVLRDP